jgi:hypothetical protein
MFSSIFAEKPNISKERGKRLEEMQSRIKEKFKPKDEIAVWEKEENINGYNKTKDARDRALKEANLKKSYMNQDEMNEILKIQMNEKR